MKQAKTLFVSDLDGTLLRSNQRLSEYTVQTINRLVAGGMIFSYATARSFITAEPVTRGISPKLPVIIYNGVFILENGTRKKLLSNQFTRSETRELADILTQAEVHPIVYAHRSGVEKFSFIPDAATPGMQHFLDHRPNDIRRNPVGKEALYDGDVFYISCIDSEEKLAPLYARLKDRFHCVYAQDIYSGAQWLELLPKAASKANAILALKELLGCDRIVCFGDGKNDLSMFEISDECYAVENADPALKRLATAVIGANDADGVAKWLEAHVDISR